MTGRLPRRPVSATATTRALVDYMYRTYHAGATVGSLAVERGRLGATAGWLSHRAALPPVAHERYGALTPPCEQLRTGILVKKDII